jgi:hypothetical protein
MVAYNQQDSNGHLKAISVREHLKFSGSPFFSKRDKVSISPIFYKQLICTNYKQAAFLYLQLKFVPKQKAVPKMLVKMPIG